MEYEQAIEAAEEYAREMPEMGKWIVFANRFDKSAKRYRVTTDAQAPLFFIDGDYIAYTSGEGANPC